MTAKILFKIFHYALQIGFSIWWGMKHSSFWQGYVFFCVWETTVILATLVVLLIVTAARQNS